MALGRLVCANHPDRVGRASCIGCHKIVCAECATPWDGIHYCAACLARRRAAEVARGGVLAWAAWALATAALFFAATWLMTWAGVLLAEGV